MSTAFNIKVTLLGCGASSGVPVVNCRCAVCQSSHPKNHRTRTAAWIQTAHFSYLIDSGPDLRIQALREDIPQIDGVLYTHAHADHVNGIDDLRAFCVAQKSPIPIYGDDATLNAITHRFPYVLSTIQGYWDKLTLAPQLVTPNSSFMLGALPITPIRLPHGTQEVLGWRLANLAWLTDISAIPDAALPHLQGLKLLYLDCLRKTPYPAHLTIEQALGYAHQVGAQQTVLIHMSHEIDYDELTQCCPQGVVVGYDGMQCLIEYQHET